MLGEHKCLILTSSHVAKLKLSVHARKYKPLLHCTESLKRDVIEKFVNRWQMNVTADI